MHLEREPGTIDVLSARDIDLSGLSTHDASLELFFDFLHKETSAEIFLVAVQPATVDFGAPLSPAVETAIADLDVQIRQASRA